MTGDVTRPLHPALPRSASADHTGMLHIGGVNVSKLAREFGTPLYVFDVHDVRARLTECIAGLGSAESLHYAAKAYLSTWLLRILDQYEVGIDVCSSTELAITMRAGITPSRVRLHGNNKSSALLRTAIRARIGAIVVDGMEELCDLISIARGEQSVARIILRLNPGIEAHTHRYLQTGILDSKFGLPIAGGDARAAVMAALDAPDAIRLLGYHAHIGTQILTVEPYQALIDTLLGFASAIHADTRFWPVEISPGGGVGITYTDEEPPSLHYWASSLRTMFGRSNGQPEPRLSVELGRSIIGNSGVAMYTAGFTKHVPGIRTYLCVDGGMADNIRPALYKARYTALAAQRMHDTPTHTVTLAGPYCESGDILIDNVELPDVQPGDLIAVPAVGAYCLPMSSNYNAALRPAVVVIENGEARLAQRRQILDDLLALDVDLS